MQVQISLYYLIMRIRCKHQCLAAQWRYISIVVLHLYRYTLTAFRLSILSALYPLFTLKSNKECNAGYKQHYRQYYAVLAAGNGHFSRRRSRHV